MSTFPGPPAVVMCSACTAGHGCAPHNSPHNCPRTHSAASLSSLLHVYSGSAAVKTLLCPTRNTDDVLKTDYDLFKHVNPLCCCVLCGLIKPYFWLQFMDGIHTLIMFICYGSKAKYSSYSNYE